MKKTKGPILAIRTKKWQEKRKASSEGESASMKKNKFMTVTLKPYMLNSRHLRLPRPFARENGINKAGEITLVDRNGVKWPSFLASAKEQTEFYMTKGWISFCVANRLKMGDTFTLEFVRGEDTTPMLKLCSKVKIEQAPFDVSQGMVQTSRDGEEKETETRVQKRARVSSEEGPSSCTWASNKSSADLKNLERKQPIQSCSFFDQVTKVKQSIVNTLTGERRFRSELEIKEQNLEALLQQINKIMQQT